MDKAMFKKFKQKISKYKIIGADSMLFSYYFYGKVPYADLAQIIIDRITDNKLTIHTSIISYLEPISYPELEKDIDKISYIKGFFLNQENLQIRSLNPKLADEAGRLKRIYKLSVPDAIQYASALIDKTQIFISNDKHFMRLTGKEKVEILLLDKYVA